MAHNQWLLPRKQALSGLSLYGMGSPRELSKRLPVVEAHCEKEKRHFLLHHPPSSAVDQGLKLERNQRELPISRASTLSQRLSLTTLPARSGCHDSMAA